MQTLTISGVFLAVLTVVQCATVGHDIFGHRVTKGKTTSGDLDEIVGMGASRLHDGVLYMHNFEGDTNIVYAVDIASGNELARFNLDGATNFDWEDMAYGPCVDDCRVQQCGPTIKPQRYCLYIGDIGSHHGDGATDVIYMVREPTVLQDDILPVVDKLTFSWPEVDAESLMITPDARLYIMSKVITGRAMVAQLPDNAWGTTVNLDLSNTGILKVFTKHHDPQGADISPDGTEMIIVGEEEVFYYKLIDGDPIKTVRETIPSSISSYTSLPDTEAIAWAADGKGFYTLARGPDNFIYYYPKDSVDADTAVIG